MLLASCSGCTADLASAVALVKVAAFASSSVTLCAAAVMTQSHTIHCGAALASLQHLFNSSTTGSSTAGQLT